MSDLAALRSRTVGGRCLALLGVGAALDPGRAFSRGIRQLTSTGQSLIVSAALLMILATAAAVISSRRQLRVRSASRRPDRRDSRGGRGSDG